MLSDRDGSLSLRWKSDEVTFYLKTLKMSKCFSLTWPQPALTSTVPHSILSHLISFREGVFLKCEKNCALLVFMQEKQIIT